MSVVLQASAPVSLTVGILLRSRARRVGVPLSVSIIRPSESPEVLGPAVCHSSVLASCGVGRELGERHWVAIPGDSSLPVCMSLGEQGRGEWFQLGGDPDGLHEATRTFSELSRQPLLAARESVRVLSRMMWSLGIPPEPALLDLVFGAPEPPLTRLSMALHLGHSLSGVRSEGTQRWFRRQQSAPVLHQAQPDAPQILESFQQGQLSPWLELLEPGARRVAAHWLRAMSRSQEKGLEVGPLLHAVTELFVHLGTLGAEGLLPPAPLSPCSALGRVLGAPQQAPDAMATLWETYAFLGGQVVSQAKHPIRLPSRPCPSSRMDRWRWLVEDTRDASEHADAIWERAMDLQN